MGRGALELNRQGPRTSWAQTLLTLAILIVLLALLGYLLFLGLRAFTKISPELAAPLIAGSLTIVGAFLSTSLARSVDRRREIEQEQRRQKIPIYEEFMAFWFKAVVMPEPGQQTVAESDVRAFMRDFTKRIITWGSDDVLKEYSEMMQSIYSSGQVNVGENKGRGRDLMLAWERVLFAIRRDLGHKNTGLGSGTLLSLFIKDWSSFEQKAPLKETMK